MKRSLIARLAPLVFALLFSLTPALAQDVTEPAAAPATLTALGSAEVSVTPDIAVLTFDMKSAALTVADAQAASVAKMEALYAALEPLGLRRSDVYTAFYEVKTVYSYQYGKFDEGESLAGYSVNSGVEVRLCDVSKTGAVIDAALQSGAESSYELSFESSQTQAAYDQALRLAAADATRKAATLAQASGAILGELASIRECGDAVRSASVVEAMGDGDAEAEPRRLLKLSATVEVMYTLAQQPPAPRPQ